MLLWFTRNLGNILVSGGLLIILFLVIRSLIKQSKSGTCGGCAYAATCGHAGSGHTTSAQACSCKDLSLEDLEKLLKEQDASGQFPKP